MAGDEPEMVRLSPPQIELLTDIATNPQMFLRRYSRWEKTGQCLTRLGLAELHSEGPTHQMITITPAGRREAEQRGLASIGGES